MMGNFKPAIVSDKLQDRTDTHRQEMSISSKSSLDLYIRQFCTLFRYSFSVHSLVQSLSICFPRPSAVECASQQYLMKVWLTGCCCVHVSVFSCFTCLHVTSQLRQETGNGSKKKRYNTGNFSPKLWVGKSQWKGSILRITGVSSLDCY